MTRQCDQCDRLTENPTWTDEGYMCEQCLTGFKQCQDCEMWLPKEVFILTVNGLVCQGCVDEFYSRCQVCEQVFPNEAMAVNTYEWRECEVCRNDKYK